jgi:hypothetical protein
MNATYILKAPRDKGLLQQAVVAVLGVSGGEQEGGYGVNVGKQEGVCEASAACELSLQYDPTPVTPPELVSVDVCPLSGLVACCFSSACRFAGRGQCGLLGKLFFGQIGALKLLCVVIVVSWMPHCPAGGCADQD